MKYFWWLRMKGQWSYTRSICSVIYSKENGSDFRILAHAIVWIRSREDYVFQYIVLAAVAWVNTTLMYGMGDLLKDINHQEYNYVLKWIQNHSSKSAGESKQITTSSEQNKNIRIECHVFGFMTLI